MSATAESVSAMDRLDHLLGRIGSELLRQAERLSRVGGSGEGAAGPLPAAQIVAMQGVDEAEQTLRELALVLRRVAASKAGAAGIDVARLAEGLTLARTASVVLGRETEAAEGGELDLF